MLSPHLILQLNRPLPQQPPFVSTVRNYLYLRYSPDCNRKSIGLDCICGEFIVSLWLLPTNGSSEPGYITACD
jgi:hypothetical protein